HYKNQCKAPKKDLENKAEANVASTSGVDDALTCFLESKAESWVLDSGASFHATSSSELFTSYTPGNLGKVYLGDDQPCDVVGKGEVQIKLNGSVVESSQSEGLTPQDNAQRIDTPRSPASTPAHTPILRRSSRPHVPNRRYLNYLLLTDEGELECYDEAFQVLELAFKVLELALKVLELALKVSILSFPLPKIVQDSKFEMEASIGNHGINLKPIYP
ncbi:F-box/RNI-like superfamily protein, partial [Fagus crenata]